MVCPQGQLWRLNVCLLFLLGAFSQITEATAVYGGNSVALGVLRSKENFTVQNIEGVGYGFYFYNPFLSALVGGHSAGGPNVTRGLVILPADGIVPAAYAPYAREVALYGYYTVIVNVATPGRVLEAMMQHPEFVYWALAGHGTGGELAARIAVTVQPKDIITTPADVTNSFSRVSGDASVTLLPGFGHYDFAYSSCVGNTKSPANGNSSLLNSYGFEPILLGLAFSVELAQWAAGTPKTLSYGNNHFLTPGFNDSKPYPGSIRVRFDELPVPNTSPQRLWWVFTPTTIKGGIVYYPGAAVDGRAYFPLAFEIAARGHLVVIVEQPARDAVISFQDANTVIDSNLTIFFGVPKGRWAISGHSNGGAGATYYLACFGNKIYAAVLHSGGWKINANTSEVPVLQMYGSLDDLGGGNNSYKYDYVGDFNPNKTTFLVVEGANHYQVGDYGYQVPDQIATISLETQHDLYAHNTVNFLDALETKAYAPVLFGPVCSG